MLPHRRKSGVSPKLTDTAPRAARLAADPKTVAETFCIKRLDPAAQDRAVLSSGSFGSGVAFFAEMLLEEQNDLLQRQADRLFPIVEVVVGPIRQFDQLPVL